MLAKRSRKKPGQADPKFNRELEDLYELCGGEKELTRVSFAEFLGVTYASYCNWRNGRYPVNEFTRNAIEAYLLLDSADLQALVAARIK